MRKLLFTLLIAAPIAAPVAAWAQTAGDLARLSLAGSPTASFRSAAPTPGLATAHGGTASDLAQLSWQQDAPDISQETLLVHRGTNSGATPYDLARLMENPTTPAAPSVRGAIVAASTSRPRS